jgi:hypothetical protein
MGLIVAAMAVPDWYYLDPDSMPRLPTNKLFYLEQRAGLCPKPTDGESLNVRMVGKWGGGPSWGVTGKDTLVYLSRGSEVVVINFADTANPQILNYIQAKRLAGRPVLVDTLLYLVTSGYIEVFNVKDPTNAPRVGRLATPVSDIDVEDTLLYSISADTFRVFDFADPASPHLVGACADSGYALDYDGGYAYLRDRWGMYILDVRDPANPHRVASWGTDIAGVKVRGNHCYVAQGSAGSGSLYVLNVANPASPWQEGVLSGVTGEDISLVDTLLFTPEFDIVNIADSNQPRAVGHLDMPQDRHGVWASRQATRAFVAANYAGMQVVDIRDFVHPVLDTWLLPMSEAHGVSVRNGVACVIAPSTGLTLLDVSDPTAIRELANLDTTGVGPSCEAVINIDSLAYAGWWTFPGDCFRVVDISDPLRPTTVCRVSGFNDPGAMVLRDSFLYCAEDYKFEVFNVANPRQPVWMGRCNSIDMVLCGLDIEGHFAYEIAGPFGLAIINIVDPANPYVVSTTTGHSTYAAGVAVRDTFAYVPSAYETLYVHSVADPARPRVLGGAAINDGGGYDICLRDSYAFLGGVNFHVFDISSPAQPVRTGYYESPYRARKVTCDSSYIYVACYLAGVAVYEILPVGLAEPRRGEPRPECGLDVIPNPVRSHAVLRWTGSRGPESITIRDVAGRVVWALSQKPATERRQLSLDLTRFGSGVYFMEVDIGTKTTSVKLVKQ